MSTEYSELSLTSLSSSEGSLFAISLEGSPLASLEEKESSSFSYFSEVAFGSEVPLTSFSILRKYF